MLSRPRHRNGEGGAFIARKIEQIELPDGYTLHWQGEKNGQSMKYLFKNFPAGHHINDCHPHYVVQGLSLSSSPHDSLALIGRNSGLRAKHSTSW